MRFKLVSSVVFFILIRLFSNATFLSLIGFYAIHYWCIENFESIIRIGIDLFRKYVRPSNYPSLKEKFGDWAVVTGATDGIGREYVKQFASQGINIVLVSRTLPKLSRIASEIESTYGVQTKCIVVDFNDGKEVYDRIESELGDIPVGILVNSVGRMYNYPDELSNVPVEVLWSLINMNIGAMITMTRIVVNRMKERQKGAIVNISSGSELQPIPYVTLYAATKVFVRHFTLGLQYELEPYGISVQLLTPYCVQTKLHTYPIRAVVGSVFFPRVETFAKSAFFTLGKTNETTGYWAHAIMNVTMRLLPIYIRTLIMASGSKRIHRAKLGGRRNSAVECIDG